MDRRPCETNREKEKRALYTDYTQHGWGVAACVSSWATGSNWKQVQRNAGINGGTRRSNLHEKERERQREKEGEKKGASSGLATRGKSQQEQNRNCRPCWDKRRHSTHAPTPISPQGCSLLHRTCSVYNTAIHAHHASPFYYYTRKSKQRLVDVDQDRSGAHERERI